MPNIKRDHPRALVVPYNPKQEQETKKLIEKCLSHVIDNVPNDVVKHIESTYQDILFIGDIDPEYRKNKKNNINTRRKVRSVKKRFCLCMKDFLKKNGVKGQWTRGNRKGILNLTIEKLWEILIFERDIRLKYLKTCLKKAKQQLHGPTKSDLDKTKSSIEWTDFLADPNNGFPQDFSLIQYYKNKARNDETCAEIYEKEKDRRKKTKEELRSIEQQINFLEKLPKQISVPDDSLSKARKLPVIQNSPKCRASS